MFLVLCNCYEIAFELSVVLGEMVYTIIYILIKFWAKRNFRNLSLFLFDSTLITWNPSLLLHNTVGLPSSSANTEVYKTEI